MTYSDRIYTCQLKSPHSFLIKNNHILYNHSDISKFNYLWGFPFCSLGWKIVSKFKGVHDVKVTGEIGGWLIEAEFWILSGFWAMSFVPHKHQEAFWNHLQKSRSDKSWSGWLTWPGPSDPLWTEPTCLLSWHCRQSSAANLHPTMSPYFSFS